MRRRRRTVWTHICTRPRWHAFSIFLVVVAWLIFFIWQILPWSVCGGSLAPPGRQFLLYWGLSLIGLVVILSAGTGALYGLFRGRCGYWRH